MLIRPAARVSLLCVLPILFAGCGPGSPRQAIIGTWQTGNKDKMRTMTFWENGVWTYSHGSEKMTGTYQFVADDRVEMKPNTPAGTEPVVYARTISFSHRDQMNTTDVGTIRRVTWKRVEP